MRPVRGRAHRARPEPELWRPALRLRPRPQSAHRNPGSWSSLQAPGLGSVALEVEPTDVDAAHVRRLRIAPPPMSRSVARQIEAPQGIAFDMRAQLVSVTCENDRLGNEGVFVIGDRGRVPHPAEQVWLGLLETLHDRDARRLIEPGERTAGGLDRLYEHRQRVLATLLHQPEREMALNADRTCRGPKPLAWDQHVDEIRDELGRARWAELFVADFRRGFEPAQIRHAGFLHIARVTVIILISVMASNVRRPPRRPTPLRVPEPPPNGRWISQ